MDNYDLSIIIPVYNASQDLMKCLNSVCQQVRDVEDRVEIIIVDDGSTDNSENVISRYENNFHLKVVRQKNKGLSAARNAGISLATGKYLYFLDSDDYLLPGAVKAFLDYTVTEADCVQFSFQRVNSQGQVRRLVRFNDFFFRNADVFTEQWSGYPWGKLFRRTLLCPFGFPEGFWFEDTVIPALIWPRVNNYVLSSTCAQAYVDNPHGITRSAARSSRSIEHITILRVLFKEQDVLGIQRSGAALDFWREHISSKAFGRVRKLSLSAQRQMLEEIHRLTISYPELLASSRSLKSRVLNASITGESLFCWAVCSLLG
ncbi:glycosyltransferase family 2 protein [Lacticaseibacillus hegangensis]|uniref:Glycosyltransferase family 2 protein n=1 Tax=Lacticaseibacillus hegangensis TaxID=2486010 RepID=A0ABW4CXV9_9LACO|nr:glycosyltransferase family 2 protein [Lacticaseibacillus hegangensis]